MRRIDFSFLFDNRDIVITCCQRKHFYFSLSAMSPWIPIQCNVTQFFVFRGVVAGCCWTNGKYHKINKHFSFSSFKYWSYVMCVCVTNKRLVESPAWTLVTCLFRAHPPSVMLGLICTWVSFELFFLSHFSCVWVENVTVYYSRAIIKWRRGAQSISAWVRRSWEKKLTKTKMRLCISCRS